MPMLSELRQQYLPQTVPTVETVAAEETIVSDLRNGMNSKQILENKFGKALLREHGHHSVMSQVLKSSFR